VRLYWQGRIDDVIQELAEACRQRGVDPSEKPADDHPLKPLIDAVRYFTNNRERMHYPEYAKRVCRSPVRR